jgi:hypothetical protein
MDAKFGKKSQTIEKLPSILDTLMLQGLKRLKEKHGSINSAAFHDIHMNLWSQETTTEDEVKKLVKLINDFTGEETVSYYLNDKMYKGKRYMLQLVSEQQKRLAA